MGKPKRKHNNMSDAKEQTKPIPANLKLKDFDSMKGDTFGGSSDILSIPVGEAVGPLTILGNRPFDPGTGKEITLWEAQDAEHNNWRMPIAANFIRQMEAGNVKAGDVIAVKRLEDVPKKKGLGAGNMMEMYQIKVLSRS